MSIIFIRSIRSFVSARTHTYTEAGLPEYIDANKEAIFKPLISLDMIININKYIQIG